MVEPITFQTIFQFLQTISIMIGIVYYLLILRNQQRNQELSLKAQQQTLETRQAQLFMGIYNQTVSSDYVSARTKVARLDYCNFDDFMKIYDPDLSPEAKENYEALDYMISFYEGLGVLVKEGLVPIRYVALLMADITRRLWEKLALVIDEIREYNNQPRIASEWEYLYDELMKYMEDHPELAT